MFYPGTPKWFSHRVTMKPSGKNVNSGYSELPNEIFLNKCMKYILLK